MNIKISAIVVGRNESKKLERCLTSLRFCDEVFYGDLNSSDSSVEIASRHRCIIHRFVKFGPSCEYTQAELIKFVRNDWVIVLDPDEVMSDSLIDELTRLLPEIASDDQVGEVRVPWKFYFGKKMLKGTVWGYNNFKGILFNRNKFEILPITHYGRRLKPGYKSFYLSDSGANTLEHYWMDDLKMFIAKHKKYLRDEGIDRFNQGDRISLSKVVYQIFSQFVRCFYICKGYRDGFTGFFLSLFWTWYITRSNLDLFLIGIRRQERTRK